ncbi:MAG TPA: copper resistance protein B [Vicinamibacterales bacterium]|nr:copper resistance protein B [Vicinamibacterales bacterium]
MARTLGAVLVLVAGLARVPAAAGQVPPHGHQPTPRVQQPQQTPPPEDHSAHKGQSEKQASGQPKQPIPSITDADRAAAFPQALEGHAVHDRGFNTFVLFDQLEWQGSGSGGLGIENTSWIGGDINRLWVRAEGETEDGRVERAFVHALWGRSFSRWWDFVAGVRQDFRPGDPQTWVAGGVQGLAPYWFELEATLNVGAGGRTNVQFEAEYDLLLTNRLVLQPLLEVEFYGKQDPERGIGSGLSSVEAGLRLRYEIRRELAPYVGIVWDRKLRGTADFAREQGDEVGTARLAFGLRTWF